MVDSPAFDPYEVLGVSRDADEIVIQLAHRARIRTAHPDLAGPAGLETAKRLNVARDWLLDPARRAQLYRPPALETEPSPAAAAAARTRRANGRRRTVHGDAASANLGPRTGQLRAFLATIVALSPDDRARVNYSLGEARPPDLQGYLEYLEPELWERSQIVRESVKRAWLRGVDEEAPLVPRLGRILPSGFLVANAFAQWILLEEAFNDALTGLVIRGEHIVDSLARRCVEPWWNSVGQMRYGPRQPDVLTFFGRAQALPAGAAERLARSWRHHMGRDGRGHPSEHLGPGVWLPSPSNYPEVLKVSGYLAAVDASRIAPPDGLAERHHATFRFGLRLTAHVLALGLGSDPARDYMRPWRDAVDPEASLWSQLGWRLSAG
jgi:curved DNA-binding protein CbpA